MSKFDNQAKLTISKLCNTFQKSYTPRPDIIVSNSIGIEIEIKFKALFPELHKKHFTSNQAFYNLNIEQRKDINQEITEAEKDILPLFEQTIDCGIPKGLDKYWEFAFNPVHNLTLLVYQIDVLRQVGLIPDGRHSLHITIANKPGKDLYWVLALLELLHCDKERIKSGFSIKPNESATWAKKGDGGILIKNFNDLIDSEHGVELRTLQFNGNLEDLSKMFYTLSQLLQKENNNAFKIKEEFLKLGLPDRKWENPHKNPETWKAYINHFEYLSNIAKSII